MRRSLRNGVALVSLSLAGLSVAPAHQAMAQEPMTLERATTTQQASRTSPEVSIGTRLAARTDPSVRQITTVYRATMSIPPPKATKAYYQLFKKAEAHAKAGRIPSDNQSRLKWVLKTAGGDVGKYFVPGKAARVAPGEIPGICTGWWVTPQGHMVTGSHCVGWSKASFQQNFAEMFLPKLTADDAKAFLQPMRKSVVIDEGLTKLAQTLFATFNVKHLKLKNPRSAVYLGSVDAYVEGKAPRLTLLRKGEDWPGLDWALLKASNMRNLPTVPLGRDGDVRVGDTLYINGYPGTVDMSPYLSRKSKDHPTLTQGAFNAMRTSIRGVPYIQTQVPVYGGNSGGPVFNKDGKVIGIAIAVLISDRIGGQTENSTLVLPVDLIKQQLKLAGVTPVTSRTSAVYYSALDDFFADRYKAALPKFVKVLRMHPQHLYVRSFIKQAKQAIAAGRDKSR
ncbi:S1 family peptidase [Nonomuraea soli]|uniref:Serine protease n=1 Tax=Nonomuraea soli TaxID=1032476 RepID=A0A7W0CCM2_9ACTN|nr:serine protease [Nonomuraea soli]MBA2888666.1 hypothetical protein [Nonomuraea soli]